MLSVKKIQHAKLIVKVLTLLISAKVYYFPVKKITRGKEVLYKNSEKINLLAICNILTKNTPNNRTSKYIK